MLTDEAAISIEDLELLEPSLVAVLSELSRAEKLFPDWPADELYALAIVGEEFGELTKALIDLRQKPHRVTAEDVRTEAIQTAAMALRFLMHFDSYKL